MLARYKEDVGKLKKENKQISNERDTLKKKIIENAKKEALKMKMYEDSSSSEMSSLSELTYSLSHMKWLIYRISCSMKTAGTAGKVRVPEAGLIGSMNSERRLNLSWFIGFLVIIFKLIIIDYSTTVLWIKFDFQIETCTIGTLLPSRLFP